MKEKTNYCELKKNTLNKEYHDKEYGFPIKNDNELFGRLILEINQAGLSWNTILRKRIEIKKSYVNFNIHKISKFTKTDIEKLLKNDKIIRNKLKIFSIIQNAKEIKKIQKQHKTFKNWLDKNKNLDKEEWIKLFKKTFKFTGKEITNEFLISTGYLKGAHQKICKIYKKVLIKNPSWNNK